MEAQGLAGTRYPCGHHDWILARADVLVLCSTGAVPVSWRIVNGLVYLESTQGATFEEWRDAVDFALADPAYQVGMGILHDWRRLQTALPTAEVVRRSQYLAKSAARFGRTRWALVVDTSAAYGMGRMAEALTGSGTGLRVFRDPAEAEAWARGEPGR